MNIVTFPWKNGDTSKLVVDVLREKSTFLKSMGNRRIFRRKKLQQRRQTLEIVGDFACEARNLGNLQRVRIPFLHFPSFSFVSFFFSFSFFSFFSFFLFIFSLYFMFFVFFIVSCFFFFPCFSFFSRFFFDVCFLVFSDAQNGKNRRKVSIGNDDSFCVK